MMPRFLIPRRRWFQFSLWTLFVLLTVFSIWFGWRMQQARDQRSAVAWLQEIRADYAYDCECAHIGVAPDGSDGYIEVYDHSVIAAPGPKWLHDLLGDDFFRNVVMVKMRTSKDQDLAPLAGLNHLVFLNLESNASLEPLSDLHRLERLELTTESDLTPLSGLTSLQRLVLNSASDLPSLAALRNLVDFTLLQEVRELAPLAELKNLKALALCKTTHADLAPLATMRNLQHLDIKTDSDLAPLATMKNLVTLNIQTASDLMPLGNLDNLERLDIETHGDLSGLSGLEHLQVLRLRIAKDVDFTNSLLNYQGGSLPLRLRIAKDVDFTPLSGLNNLRELYIYCPQVVNLQTLHGLKNLKHLHIEAGSFALGYIIQSGRTDVPLSQMPAMDVVRISRLRMLEYLSLACGPIRDITPLSRLTKLEELHLQYTEVTDFSPLAKLTRLKKLTVRGGLWMSTEQREILQRALPNCDIGP
jgi:internalin A